MGVIAGERVFVRAQQRDPDFHSLATSAFAGSVRFRQTLRLIGRLRRGKAILHEIVRNSDTFQVHRTRVFLSFGQRDIADGDVSVNFVEHVAQHPKAGRSLRFRLTLLGMEGR